MTAQRVFFALWPDAALADEIVPRAARLGLGGRLVARERLHLTLAFHGLLDRTGIKALIDRADALDAARFTLVIDRLGMFAKSDTLWFASSRPAARLCELARALAAPGVDPSRFMPHITVARGSRFHDGARLFPPLIWHVDAFALVASGTAGKAGAYETLARWPLRLGPPGTAHPA